MKYFKPKYNRKLVGELYSWGELPEALFLSEFIEEE